MSIETIKQHNISLLVPQMSQSVSKQLTADWFEIEFWRNRKAIAGKSVGRNITWFVRHETQEWVLRHYYRGGLIAKYIDDQYFFTTMKSTRCYRELNLLQQMSLQGLPVPKPIAARVIKSGLFYRADLLIEKIPHTRDLVAQLSKEALAEVDWHAIGGLIAKFHQTGIYHADLNAHNILIDDKAKFWLIDFDRCSARTPDKSWRQKNLARLKRSFKKEKNKIEDFHFDDLQWHWLIQGYENFYHKAVTE